VSQSNELVFLKPDTDDGAALLSGSVKVNYPNLDLSKGIRLLRLPQMQFSNPGGQSHGTGFTGSNPDFSPVVVETYLDKSVPRAFQCCVKGDNIGKVTIYQLVSSGDSLTILSTYVLENTYLAKWFVSFDAPTDQVTGDGIVAKYVLMCTGIVPSQTQFDEAGTATGKIATEVNRTKQTSQLTT